MSEIKFNAEAMRHLTDNPSGKIARTIQQKARELAEAERSEAAIILAKVPRSSVDNMVNATMIGASEAVVGVVRQANPRPGSKKSLTEYLAEKAIREQDNGWMHKGIRRHGYFRRRS